MGADAPMKCTVAGDWKGRTNVDSSIPIRQEQKGEVVHHSFSTPVETLTTYSQAAAGIASSPPTSQTQGEGLCKANPLAAIQNGSQQ